MIARVLWLARWAAALVLLAGFALGLAVLLPVALAVSFLRPARFAHLHLDGHDYTRWLVRTGQLPPDALR